MAGLEAQVNDMKPLDYLFWATLLSKDEIKVTKRDVKRLKILTTVSVAIYFIAIALVLLYFSEH